MERGAVAMIDTLGFKGAWGTDPKKPSTDLLDTLKAVRDAVRTESLTWEQAIQPKAFPGEIRNLIKSPRLVVRFLSDTVVIAASVTPRKRAPKKAHEQASFKATGMSLSARNAAVDAFMRYVVCRCIGVAVRTAALAKRPIAYRGAVSTGLFAIEENFILGPAVDEAAGLMEAPDAAIVWLAPGAGRIPDTLTVENDNWRDMAFRLSVPLKDGRTVRAMTLNPFAHCTTEDAKIMRKNILRSMSGDRLELVLKYQNTQRFFRNIDTERHMIQVRDKYGAKKREKEQAVTTATDGSRESPPAGQNGSAKT